MQQEFNRKENFCYWWNSSNVCKTNV